MKMGKCYNVFCGKYMPFHMLPEYLFEKCWGLECTNFQFEYEYILCESQTVENISSCWYAFNEKSFVFTLQQTDISSMTINFVN